MKLNEDVYVLALPVQMGSQALELHPILIVDQEHGPTLIDTGFTGQNEALAAALGEAGVQLSAIKRIILTHQDIDHVGLLHDLVATSGAQVLAYSGEIAAIDGTVQPRFMSAAMLERMPMLRPIIEQFRPTPVDIALGDGEWLDLAGGVRAIFTPGHTPGHMSLYLERTKTLITGDALTANGGQLAGPNEQATMDLALARRSIQKLAELEVETIVCYHGGVVQNNAQQQLALVLANAQEVAA